MKTWNGASVWRLDDPKYLKDLLNAKPQLEEHAHEPSPGERGENYETKEQKKNRLRDGDGVASNTG